MGLRIIPKDEKFFDLFVEQAENTLVGAKQLKELLNEYTDFDYKSARIKKTESHGDELTHNILEKLNTTFITPIDSEDIHALTSSLDDILDIIYSVVQRLSMYRIKTITPEAQKMANVIVICSEEIVKIMSLLEKMKHTKEIKAGWIEVNRLENEGDDIQASAIKKLFENETDPIEIIKWKEIYEYLESAIDKCEDTTNVVETIILKNT